MPSISIAASALQSFSNSMNNISQRQVPFAMSLALNLTALDVKAAQYRGMRSSFDNPTRYTLNSLYVKSSTKRNLVATVGVKDNPRRGTAPAHYLFAEVHGGKRKPKKFEKALAAKGIIKKGQVTIPGKGAKLNKSGNISLQSVKALLEAFGGRAANRQPSARRGLQFIAVYNSRGKIDRIYVRSRNEVEVFLYIRDNASYRQTYKFFDISSRVIEDKFAPNFRKAWIRAISTSNR